MFKDWSIKELLKGWSLLTLLAMICVAMIAIYTNSLYSSSEKIITEKLLPLENANRNMTSIMASLFTLQQKAQLSTPKEMVQNRAIHENLEQEFERYSQQIRLFLSDNSESADSTDVLMQHYRYFLKIDKELLVLLADSSRMNSILFEQVKQTEFIETQLQNELAVLLDAFSKALDKAKTNPESIVNSLVMSSHYDLTLNQVIRSRELARALKLELLKLVSLSQLVIRATTEQHLSRVSELEIQKLAASIESNLNVLTKNLGPSFTQTSRIKALKNYVAEFSQLVSRGSDSVYELQQRRFDDEQKISELKKESLGHFVLVMDILKSLSKLINQKNLEMVQNSAEHATKAAWLTFFIVLSIMLGVAQFIRLMSNWITRPLSELRAAMHALSDEIFDTRINEEFGKSEFSQLAQDFNVFAENNERLIHDLASAKEVLEAREQHISAILNGVTEAILTISSTGEIISTNPEAERVLKASHQKLQGLKITQFFDPLEHIEDITDVANLLEISQEFIGRDYLGNQFSMWMSLNSLNNLEDEIWVCVISDITAQKKAEQELRKTSVELDTILDNAMVGIAFIRDRSIMRVNSKFEQLFQCDREKIEGESIQCIYPSYETYLQLGEQAYSVLQQGDNYEAQVQLVRNNGEKFWCSMSSKAIDFTKPYEGSIWLFEDITQQRINDEKLRKLASLDVLTELPNRAVFNDRLAHAVHKAHRKANGLAVFFLDLDHFKNINDSLGHKAGDALLCQVAERLKACVREGDTVARLGGDEFTVILEEIRSAQYVAKVAEKIAKSVSDIYEIENTEVTISTSIGISLYPADGRDVEDLVKNADAAMYHAKKNGRNNFQFYSGEMNAQAAERLAMETALRRAVAQNEFYLNFQPQIDIKNNKIIGAEALLRWTNVQWGDVSPAVFVPILEDIGLIGRVGEDVLKQACQAYSSLKDRLVPEFKMAVNLSGRQFHGGKLPGFVRDVLQETAMDSTNLELEITESILMDDADLAIRTMNKLSDMGITLAIDDFGTGYSSLSYLKRFPLNVLKIDRSFVRDVTIDPDDAAIVDAILAMSRRLHLDVVAEGVETQEQLDFLKENQCSRVQGYYLSKPLTLENFIDYIDNFDNQQALSS